MIVNSEYNEKTGTANVVVRGKHGDIGSGKARLHEEDREYGSELVGCLLFVANVFNCLPPVNSEY